ncbi:MAG TPA: laccase domain-containing protein [Acidimicrobiales bacterium]
MALVPGATTRTLDGHVHAAWADASRGDLRPSGPSQADGSPLAALATDLASATGAGIDAVVWATQVHGPGVAVVGHGHDAGGTGTGIVFRNFGDYDALVTAAPGTALCVLTADCAAIALASAEGVCSAVHAGWRGLVAGVVEAAVTAMRDLGASDVTASLGPCIHAPCYEFSPTDLDTVAAVYGPSVRGTTTGGRPALDLVAAVAAAVAAAGARFVDDVDVCTACGARQFSHRARRDVGRQALLVWPGDPGDGL